MNSDNDLIFLLTFMSTATYPEQMIDIDVLKMLKTHHISKLFQDLTTGEQAKFEFHLEKWKKQFEKYSPDNQYIMSSPNTTSNQPPTVMKILSNTSNGKDILKFHHNNNILHEEQRNLLINTITKYIESKSIICSLSDCSDIEKQICAVFPTEKLEFYTNGKRGKIYNKLANYRRLTKNILKLDEPEGKDNLPENEENYTSIIEGLRSSNIPQYEFDIYWQKCAPLRFQQIADSKNTSEIFKLWPEYTKPSGHLLIDIDFELKYPMAKKLQERWPYFAAEILFILKTKITCSLVSKKLLQSEHIDEDSKMFTILWYCHNLFPPQLKISTDQNGAKFKKKYSVVDSQEAFAVVAGTMEELDTKLKLLRIQGRSIQPKLLVIGDTTNVKQIYVHIF